MIKKNNILYVIIFSLLILNLILLYKNFQKQNWINNRSENNLSENGIVSSFTFNKFVPNENKKIIVLTLITTDVCGSCLINEIKYLNILSNKFNKYLIVLYEGPAQNLINLGAKFQITEIGKISKEMQIDVTLDNPVTLVIDKHGNIQNFHKAINGKPEISSVFFNKLISLFDSIYSE